jgi:drug/metabolite transporter (DMT)-like permease
VPGTKRNSFRVLAVYACCCVLWGSSWLAIKIGLREWPPMLFAGLRMTLASACLLPFVARRWSERPPKQLIGRMLALGVLQIGIPYPMLFVAQQWLPSSIAAVLFATFPVWLMLTSRLFVPGERLTLLKLAAAALGLAGVLVLQLPRLRGLSFGSREALGAALVLGSAMLIATANALVRRLLGGVRPMMVTFFQISSGAVVILTLAGLLEHRAVFPSSWPPVAALFYLAIFGTVATYLCFFWLIRRISMAAVGIVPLIDTTIAVLLGVFFLDETLTRYVLIGGALVLGAGALANRPAPTAGEGATEAG